MLSADQACARRFMVVDLARGVAIALMFVNHITFDLNNFGVVFFDFNHDLRKREESLTDYHLPS